MYQMAHSRANQPIIQDFFVPAPSTDSLMLKSEVSWDTKHITTYNKDQVLMIIMTMLNRSSRGEVGDK
jgi:hypothetical protein